MKEVVPGASRPESIMEGEAHSDEEDESGIEADVGGRKRQSDARSIRSVGSMMSGTSRRDEKKEREKETEREKEREKEEVHAPKMERVSLSNRLASIGVLGRLSSPASSDGSSLGVSPSESAKVGSRCVAVENGNGHLLTLE
jgi:hypothetical protein